MKCTAILGGAALFLVGADAFGPFKSKCNTFEDQSSCLSKNYCSWCNSTDTDSSGTPFDELCFSTTSAKKLNTSDWVCNARLAGNSIGEAPPASSYFSLYQQSDSKHCVELDVDAEASKNASCFQKFWAVHGYQFDKYEVGRCPKDYNFVNLKDTICNSSISEESYGCAVFTLGKQD